MHSILMLDIVIHLCCIGRYEDGREREGTMTQNGGPGPPQWCSEGMTFDSAGWITKKLICVIVDGLPSVDGLGECFSARCRQGLGLGQVLLGNPGTALDSSPRVVVVLRSSCGLI